MECRGRTGEGRERQTDREQEIEQEDSVGWTKHMD